MVCFLPVSMDETSDNGCVTEAVEIIRDVCSEYNLGVCVSQHRFGITLGGSCCTDS